MRIAPAVLLLAAASVTGAEVPTVDRDGIHAAFGWDPETTEITIETLAPGLHVLFGMGGNIGVSIGEQGTLIVDDQAPELVERIEAAIEGVGGGPVDFVVNTHWHFDHADGNLALGPGGAWIVAQENARADMARGGIIDLVQVRYDQEPYPEAALPVITFDDRMSFHFNGERIDLLHAGPAHTTGDVAVLFRGHDAVHLGDVFNNTGWPFIDAGSGGSLDGVIAFCRAVLGEIDADTTVIPGHGPVTDGAGLARYVEVLEIARERLVALIEDGADLEAIVAAEPTADLDAEMGDPGLFLDRAYASLTRLD
jgi:glyoxylase-like metal-dependent hydrolase (beta-lactamase superfamily II)